jgi:hypothetical protein
MPYGFQIGKYTATMEMIGDVDLTFKYIYIYIYIYIGKITRAPRCLGILLNTYKICDVLYITRGMYDLYISSRH